MAENNPIPAYRGIFDALRSIYVNEGVGALYRGISMNIVAGSLANSIFFYTYNQGKKTYGFDENKPYGLKTILLSYRAGLTSMAITTPFWTVKTRMALFQEYDGN